MMGLQGRAGLGLLSSKARVMGGGQRSLQVPNTHSGTFPQSPPTLPRVLPRAHLALAGSCLPKDVVYLQEPLANKQAG